MSRADDRDREIEALRAEFVGMVSHELRTPLAAIKGSSASVLGAARAFAPAEMREFFRVVDEQADRMAALADLPVIFISTPTVATRRSRERLRQVRPTISSNPSRRPSW